MFHQVPYISQIIHHKMDVFMNIGIMCPSNIPNAIGFSFSSYIFTPPTLSTMYFTMNPIKNGAHIQNPTITPNTIPPILKLLRNLTRVLKKANANITANPTTI